MARPLYEPSAEAAAKIVARHLGIRGDVGGYLRRPDGSVVCQGWSKWTRRLMNRKAIVAREVTHNGDATTRWAVSWTVVADYRW
jgi:hypothetical protein